MLTHQEIESRVATGAALLDADQPNWFRRVDVGRLQLSDCAHCVVGQLTARDVNLSDEEHFKFGLARLGLWTNAATAAHGFAVARDDYDVRASNASDVADELFARLQDAWIAAIAHRLHPEPSVDVNQFVDVLTV